MADNTIANVNFQAASESAKQQMDFQERMSNTAHQREVQDLIAAGLNPVLSANAGASSPVGAEGYVSSAKAKKFDEQVAAYELEQKKLDYEHEKEMLKEKTNAQLLLNSAKMQAQTVKQAAAQGISKGSSSSGSSSKKSNSTSSNKTNSSSYKSSNKVNINLTGNEVIDQALSNLASKNTLAGLVLAGTQYVAQNASVGKYVAPSGSAAKAKLRYEQIHAAKPTEDTKYNNYIHRVGR